MPRVAAFDAAFGGIGVAVYDGQRIEAVRWKAFPAHNRTLAGLRDWLDTEVLPVVRSVDRVFVESTNVFPEAADAETGKPRSFMIQYQVSVRECAMAVSMWCVLMDVGHGDPEMVYPASWRSAYKSLIPKPRPKGAAAWKDWSCKTAPLLFPGCLNGLGQKAREDVADACLLASYGWSTMQPSTKVLKEKKVTRS